MALGVTIMVIVILALMWKSAKGKTKSSEPIQESVQQDEPPKDSMVEELMNHLILLFNTSLNKWCFKKDMVYLTGVGIQYHYYEFKSYIHDFWCGTIEREPTNPKDKRAIRFVDIEGKTIGYIPKDELTRVYETFGDDFEPRPFFGKIVHHPDGRDISVLFAITYGNNLLDEKKGARRIVMEHIDSFINSDFDYYREVN